MLGPERRWRITLFSSTGLVLALLALSGVGHGISSASATSEACGSKGSTFAKDGGGEIYALPKKGLRQPSERPIYACLTAKTPLRLSPVWVKGEGDFKRHIQFLAKPFALASPWAAGVGYTRYGVDVDHVDVKAVNLRTGAVRECPVGQQTHPGGAGKLTDLVLKRNGAVAWINQEREYQGSPGAFSLVGRVVACDSLGQHQLGRSSEVDVHSLSLHGSTLSWSDHGTTEKAELR